VQGRTCSEADQMGAYLLGGVIAGVGCLGHHGMPLDAAVIWGTNHSATQREDLFVT
jgi:hypothetical protein